MQDSAIRALGVQPSIGEDEIKKYLEEVLREKKAYKKEDE